LLDGTLFDKGYVFSIYGVVAKIEIDFYVIFSFLGVAIEESLKEWDRLDTWLERHEWIIEKLIS